MRVANVIAYVSVGVLTVILYPLVHDVLTVSGIRDTVVVSNLTLNIVLVGVILGGSSPWLIKKLFPRLSPKKRRLLLVPTALLLAALYLIILYSGGYELKFIS